MHDIIDHHVIRFFPAQKVESALDHISGFRLSKIDSRPALLTQERSRDSKGTDAESCVQKAVD